MFKGLVAEIPVGIEGLTGTKNMSQVRPSQLLIADNLTYENGTLQKEGGAEKYNSTAITGTPKILGGFDWHPDTVTQRMVVVADDGNIYKDDGGGAFSTTLKSGLSFETDAMETHPIFVEGGKEAAANDRKLLIFTGKNQVQVLSADGVTTSDLASPPADWSGTNQPYFGLVHEDRLWGGGNLNDPHRLYYSLTTDHEDMSGGTISIFPGEGQQLIHAFSYKGFIIAFKDVGIYAVDTTDPTVSNWKVKRISRTIGPAWIGSVTPVEDDIIFIDQTGSIRTLGGIDQFGDVGTRSIGDPSEINTFIRDNLTFNETHKWKSIYYSHKRELHFSVTGIGATTNNARLVMDINKEIPRFRYSTRDNAVSLWLRRENSIPRLMMGDDIGFVWKLDREDRSKDSQGYEGTFQSAHIDFSQIDAKLGTMRKNGRFLELVVEPKGNWNLSMDILWDGAYHETVQFNMGTTGAALGSFVFGTDKLGGGQVLNKKRKITSGGRRISLVGSNSGAGQDFSVARFFLHFVRGDESLK